VIIELAGGGVDTVSSAITTTLSANVENLTLTGLTAINGTGNADANSLVGNTAANVLDGRAGADTLSGGQGNDTYVVDNIGDVVVEALNQGTDLVQAGVNHTLAANVENLTLTGTAVEGTGNTLVNVIVGDALANRLDGLQGNDTLTGGLGNDQFIFDTAPAVANLDTITDFSTGDLIVLDAATFAGIGLHNTSLDATMLRQGPPHLQHHQRGDVLRPGRCGWGGRHAVRHADRRAGSDGRGDLRRRPGPWGGAGLTRDDARWQPRMGRVTWHRLAWVATTARACSPAAPHPHHA
jgi:hypothetical protein